MSTAATPLEETLDVAALTRAIDGRWAEIRRRVREVLDSPDFAPVHGLPSDEHRERVFEQMRKLVVEGGSALGFPTEYGGEGDPGGAVTAFETLGHGDLSLLVKCGVQFGLFGGALLHLGTRKHHERHLEAMIRADLPGAFAMTETGHGSNVQEIETTATYDPETEEFVLHTPHLTARKDYIGNAATHGRMASVFAQLETLGATYGVHCFLVPIRDEAGAACEGVTIGDDGEKAGLNGVDNGRLSFDHVRVERDALLDRFGSVAADGTYSSPIESENRRFFTMLGTLIQGRISVAGAAVSATKSGLAIAVRYAERRRQFGPPDSGTEVHLLDYRAHQRRLLPRIATTYALHAAQAETVAELHRSMTEEGYADEDKRRLEARAAGIKTRATWHATSSIQECREACGGAGYLAENRLPQLKADTDVFTTFEGDNTVLLQLVAKSLLTDYRDAFGALDTLGTVRFVADQVLETVVERTSARQLLRSLVDIVPRKPEDLDLYDRATQIELIAWREEHLVSTAARRLKNGIDDGADPFDVFNDCQDHVLAAARAHVDTVVMESFARLVDATSDAGSRAILDRLCSLHALSVIEQGRAFFLEHGRLTPTRAKGVIAAVNALCAELRPHARVLVDAWAIPEIGLRVPMVEEYA